MTKKGEKSQLHTTVTGGGTDAVSRSKEISNTTDSRSKNPGKIGAPAKMQPLRRAASGMSTLLGDHPYGWKKVQRNLPRILEYGIREGILAPVEEVREVL